MEPKSSVLNCGLKSPSSKWVFNRISAEAAGFVSGWFASINSSCLDGWHHGEDWSVHCRLSKWRPIFEKR